MIPHWLQKLFGKKSKMLHNTVFIGLWMLVLGKLVFRYSTDFLYSFLVLFVTILAYYTITNWKQIMNGKAPIFNLSLQNSLIYGGILLLLISPTGTLPGLAGLVLVTLFGLVMRDLVRYHDKPIFNPAVFALLALALFMQFAPTSIPVDIYASWHGVNYRISALGFNLPFATAISMLLAVWLTAQMRKYWYALWFFLSFIVGGYFLLGLETTQSILLDGTIYFFFWVMASEPKTGPSGRYQWFFWALLAIILLLLLKYHIPGDYVSALAILNLLYFVYRYFSDRRNVLSEPAQVWQKYICVPCGFIYDPRIGDTDSGILAGTEFADIPDDWRCPVCGVTKSDFIPYDDASALGAIIVEKNYLNATTIELTIETPEAVATLPGQFAKLILKDRDGEFSRSYSVVRQEGRNLVFGIKLTGGRASKVLSQMKEGSGMGFWWVFGNFLLQDAVRPKVFIATGTGLSPIIHMLDHTTNNIPKTVYFSVSTKEELFYEEALRGYENTNVHIFVSREEVPGYQSGRIRLDPDFSLDTEFYLCGNPTMIREKKEELLKKWYEYVYAEAFL